MSTLRKMAAVGLVLGAAAVAGKTILDKLSGEPVYLQSGNATNGPVVKSLEEAALGGEVSKELLDILVCPLDKGKLRLSDDGKWLVNPRNGYRYPIRDGIPIMLIDEGKKYQDSSLIAAS
jgi:uncharacterized protein YbaR (Trm112 family)